MDKAKRPIMEKNISWAKDECKIEIFNADVLCYIPRCNVQYSIVYADPPFPMPDKIRILQAVNDFKTVKDGGQFIVHIPAAEENLWPQELGSFKLTDTRKYGRNMIKFYTNSVAK